MTLRKPRSFTLISKKPLNGTMKMIMAAKTAFVRH